VSPFEDDRVLAIVRYRERCDLGALVDALRAGGIDAIEITADTLAGDAAPRTRSDLERISDDARRAVDLSGGEA
jgi:2-keto-3-deoxy-6-phosphogluconate aldolase